MTVDMSFQFHEEVKELSTIAPVSPLERSNKQLIKSQNSQDFNDNFSVESSNNSRRIVNDVTNNHIIGNPVNVKASVQKDGNVQEEDTEDPTELNEVRVLNMI